MAVAAAVCSAEHDCDCLAPAWPDRETCVDSEILRLQDSAVIASDHDLSYDGACVGLRVKAYADAGCDRDVALEPCALSCKPYVGEAAEGEPCERLGITVAVDTCAQGLRCEGGVCVPSCALAHPLEEGAPCAAGIESLGECTPTHYCTPDTERCAPRPRVGESCPDAVCEADAWCDRSSADAGSNAGVCVARRAAGAACTVDTQCQSDRCVDDACTAVPASACSFR